MDVIILDGDTALFHGASFGGAIVTPSPGTMVATGSATVSGASICVEGDEGSVSVPGNSYITASHTIPGAGTLTIDSLGVEQVAMFTKDNGTLVILLGAVFNAKFTVDTPAQVPGSPPVPDATPSYMGTGNFVTSNLLVMGT